MEIISSNNSTAIERRRAAFKKLLTHSPQLSWTPRPALSFISELGVIPQYKYTFGVIYLFTLVLYMRPSELIPPLAALPIGKIVAILAPVAYIFEKQSSEEKFLSSTIENKMVLCILVLALLFMPLAMRPMATYGALNDPYMKIVIMFSLMIQVVNHRVQLRKLFGLVTFFCAFIAAFAIRSYVLGITGQGGRIVGIVGGMFANPNDMALGFNMAWPISLMMALTSTTKFKRFYNLLAVGLLVGGVFASQSRGGFLGAMAIAGLLVWKLGRGRRLKTILLAAILGGALIPVLPGNYVNRIASIFDNSKDEVGSAQERRVLADIAFKVALDNPIIGVGMGNFIFYSFKEKPAHNAYLEIAAELGVLGLLAYLIIILAPIVKMNRMEAALGDSDIPEHREIRYLCIGVQASVIAFLVGSFFGSVQYMWNIYYHAFFAIALTRIYAMEGIPAGPLKKAPSTLKGLFRNASSGLKKQPPRNGGVLWPSKTTKVKFVAASRER